MASRLHRAVALSLSSALLSCAQELIVLDPPGARDKHLPDPIPIGTPVADDSPPVHQSGFALDGGICWSDFAPLNQGRFQHAAAVVPGGGIVVAGGSAGVGPLDSVEFYDPQLDRWVLRAPMPTARRAAVAVALTDGRVLVTGGAADRSNGPNTPPDIVPLDSVELYDPVADTWERRAPMHGRRWLHAAHQLPDGRVLVAGGVTEAAQVAAELYDPVADSWKPLPFVNSSSGGPRFVALAGIDPHRVLVVSSTASFVIDVEQGFWRFLAPRKGLGPERVYAGNVGGELWTFAGAQSRRSERFDADAGVWAAEDAELMLGRDFAVGLTLDQGQSYILTSGYLIEPGWHFAPTAITDLFVPDGGVFLPAGRLKVPRGGHALVELRPGVPLVIGGGALAVGAAPDSSASVEIFDPHCPQLGDASAQ